jgi:membrane carboxypeptidase/penicillin-binding protein
MVSVSPRLIIVTWLGYQCHSDIQNYEKLYSSDTAAAVWAEFLKSVNKYRPDLLAGSFEQPNGVREAVVDPAHGCLSERGVSEFFKESAMPAPCGKRQ